MTRQAAIAFTALCLVAGSGWIVDAALPDALPGALGLLFDSALLALIFFLTGGRQLPRAPLRILGYAALLVAAPVALASLSSGHLSSTTIVLVYTLVPAATVFFAAQASHQDLLPLLGPALAGVAGAALILPFTLPSSLAGQLSLAALILSALAAGVAGFRLHTLLAGTRTFPVAALSASASTLVALILYAVERPTFVLLTKPQVLVGETVHLATLAATLIFTIRLLRDLPPIAFSTRYLLAPGVTIAEGYLILHPHTGWTLAAGLLLLAGGSALLLRAEPAGYVP